MKIALGLAFGMFLAGWNASDSLGTGGYLSEADRLT